MHRWNNNDLATCAQYLRERSQKAATVRSKRASEFQLLGKPMTSTNNTEGNHPELDRENSSQDWDIMIISERFDNSGNIIDGYREYQSIAENEQ